jgi:hypothetical protein
MKKEIELQVNKQFHPETQRVMRKFKDKPKNYTNCC